MCHEVLYSVAWRRKMLQQSLWGRCPVLDVATELKLVRYIKSMESKLFGLTRKNVIEIAFTLA